MLFITAGEGGPLIKALKLRISHLYYLVADMAVLGAPLIQIDCLNLRNSICF